MSYPSHVKRHAQLATETNSHHDEHGVEAFLPPAASATTTVEARIAELEHFSLNKTDIVRDLAESVKTTEHKLMTDNYT